MLSVGAVGVGAVCDGNDGDLVSFLIDAIDHPVGPAMSAVTVVQRCLEALADAPGVVQQGAHDELVRGERDRPGKSLGELAARAG